MLVKKENKQTKPEEENKQISSLNASLEGIDQGDTVCWQLLVQLTEQHGTFVPFLGPAEGVQQPGLEVENVSELLFAVHFGKVSLGFI